MKGKVSVSVGKKCFYISYDDILIKKGLASKGNYILNLDDKKEYKVSYAILPD